MDYYRRYIGDYRRDTAGLSLLEHGAYGALMDEAYASERPLPNEHASLYRICVALTAEEQAAVRIVADRFFPVLADGSRYHRRVAAELEKGLAAIAGHVAGAAITNGKRSAERSASRLPSRSASRSTSHPPPMNHQPPTKSLLTTSLQPSTEEKDIAAAPPKSRRRAAAVEDAGTAKLLEATRATWAAYAEAYERRWRASPVRSSVANAHIKAFCQIVPHEEAAAVAAFYVSHDRGLYVSSHHDLALLRRDAHSLRTEWFTNQPQTDTAVRQTDRMASTRAAFAGLIEEADERERVVGNG